MKVRSVFSIQIVSQQGIRSADTMVHLVLPNAYISGYVMHDSVGIILHMWVVHTSRCVFAPQLASIHWHAIGTK